MKKIFLFTLLAAALTQQTAWGQARRNAQTLEKTKIKANTPTMAARSNAGCDTINFPIPSTWNFTLYSVSNGGGLVTGTNEYDDKEKGAFFDASATSNAFLLKAFVYFGAANTNTASSLNKNIVFKVYGGDLNNGPGTLLSTVSKSLSSVKSDVAAARFTEVIFPAPVALPASKLFFVTAEFTEFKWDKSSESAQKDTIAIVSTTNGDALTGNSGMFWEKWSDNRWFAGIDAWSSNTSDFDVNLAIFPILGATPDCASLPVTLASFTGERQQSKNLLKWTTVSEANNKGFEVERSADGIHYTTVGFAASKGAAGNSSGVLTYTYEDNKPFAGQAYYRLKQVDKDGRFSNSQVVVIKAVKAAAVQLSTLYPNPVRSQLGLVVNAPNTGKLTVAITDLEGRMLQQQTVQAVAGSNNLQVNVGRLAAGTYVVKVWCAEGCEAVQSRFVKQ